MVFHFISFFIQFLSTYYVQRPCPFLQWALYKYSIVIIVIMIVLSKNYYKYTCLFLLFNYVRGSKWDTIYDHTDDSMRAEDNHNKAYCDKQQRL